jgi:hypothetical protein
MYVKNRPTVCLEIFSLLSFVPRKILTNLIKAETKFVNILKKKKERNEKGKKKISL